MARTDPLGHIKEAEGVFHTRLYDWVTRGLSGLVIWLGQYLRDGVRNFPSEQLRLVACRINELCDEADEKGLSGGNHALNVLKGLRLEGDCDDTSSN